MEFRVVPLQTGGLSELREAAVLTYREHSNTGGTVVNHIVDHPAKIYDKSLRVFLCL